MLMKWIPTLWCVVALLGCQQTDGAAPKAKPAEPGRSAPAGPADLPHTRADAPYRSDIEKLCDVVARSGADQVPEGERQLPIANWLAANLETPESRKFLVHIQPLVGEPKAAALEAEARRVGLPGCALAAEWR
jgi:hypothetical protein